MPEDLPKGWVRTTLGEVCAMNPRMPFNEPRPDYTEVSFVPMDAVEEESGRLDASQIRTLGSVRRGYTPFKENDVIFAKITPCMQNGKVALATGLKNGLAYGSTEFFVLRSYEGVLPRFLLYFLLQRSLREEAEHHMSGGTGHERVPSNYLFTHKLLLPPTAEQERIVAKLDAALSGVERAETAALRAQERLERYRAAVLQSAATGELTQDWRELQRSTDGKTADSGEALLQRLLATRRQVWEEAEFKRLHAAGKAPKDDKWKSRYPEPVPPKTANVPDLPEDWTWASIEQVSVRVTVGYVGPMKSEYASSGIPFLRSQNVRANRFNPEGLLFIQPEFHAKLIKSRMFPGDVVVVRSGLVGTSCVIPESLGEANCSDLVIIQRPLIEPHFIAFYLNSAAQKYVEAGKVGIALTHFNTASVASLPISVPPFGEQIEIVRECDRRLSGADRLGASLKQQLTRAAETRQSLLHEAFAGRIVPQDSSEEPSSVLLERIRAAREAEAKKPKVKRMRKLRSTITRRPLLDVLREQKKPITPEKLFSQAGFKPPQVDLFYRELASLRDKLQVEKPKPSEAKSWPDRAHVTLQLKED